MEEIIISNDVYLEQLNRIYDELKHRENLSKNDFSNLYMSLSISIAFYGTIMAFISKNTDIDIFVLYSFLFLLIPVFTYIFGLLFCYNLFAIIKGGYVTTTLEKRVKEIQKKLYKQADFIGWGVAEERKNLGRVLVYGTILMFYISLPVLSIIWGLVIVASEQVDALSISFIIISAIFYAVYLIFIGKILAEMKYFYKIFQNNHNYFVNK